MALSLLRHLQDTQATALNGAIQEMGLNASQAQTLIGWTFPLVLAHLVDLNQRHGTGLVLALVNTQAVDGIWHTLDQAEWVIQVQKHMIADRLMLEVASNHIATVVLAEIFALVDQASLGEEGLNELLEGQSEHLQGQAPDWIWQQAGLTQLCGQAAAEPDPTEALDLATGIASLNKLMRQAATQVSQAESVDAVAAQPATPQSHTSVEQAVTNLDLNKNQPSHHDHNQHDDHHHATHATIILPTQRDAGGLTRLFEPLIAAGILGLLYLFFINTTVTVDPIHTIPAGGAATALSTETALIPTEIASESDLPAMSGTQLDQSEIERATAEAQRTGAEALQFSDNALSN